MIAIQPGRDTVLGASREELDARAAALKALVDAKLPFLVAGAYAFFEHTGIYRETKDLDIAVRKRDMPDVLQALERAGFRTEVLDPVWLGKAYAGKYFIDLLFSSGNGIADVDDVWFENATQASVMGYPCLLTPPEEMIWTKCFVNERERYDGADVNHLIYACGDRMDWHRLLARFEPHWEVLYSALVLYRFTYPCAKSRVPEWLMTELCQRTMADLKKGDDKEQVCRGHLISRAQYRHDYECLGFHKVEGPEPNPPESALECRHMKLDKVG